MTRRVLLGLAAAMIAVSLVTLGVPPLLAQIDFFLVRQVELIGVRHLSPDVVLAALELPSRQNLFDDLTPVEQRARTVTGVVEARVERRLPATLRVVVTERVPVAFTAGPAGLVPLDATARPLPYDPARSGLALPLVERADSVLVAAVALLRTVDRELYQEIDDVRYDHRNGITFWLGDQRLSFSGLPTSAEMEAVSAVRRHLSATGRTFEELDARFAGWVIVRGRGA